MKTHTSRLQESATKYRTNINNHGLSHTQSMSNLKSKPILNMDDLRGKIPPKKKLTMNQNINPSTAPTVTKKG